MRRISSRSTWWYKKAFPGFCFGFLGLFTLILAWGLLILPQKVPLPLLLFPLGLAAFGYVMMQWLVFPLMDEVWIDGNEIVVRNSGQEECFPATNIINVEAPLFWDPERIVLTLKEPCVCGGASRICKSTASAGRSTHPSTRSRHDAASITSSSK